MTELQRAGIAPPRGSEGLWTASLRHSGLLIGLTVDREELARRIDRRVDAMFEAGVEEEVRAAAAAGTSRTARAALGFEQVLAGDREAMKSAHRAYGRRQLTWMRRMKDVHLIDRTGRSDAEIAGEIAARLG
jgi:tRNA dimethylallyltransferase